MMAVFICCGLAAGVTFDQGKLTDDEVQSVAARLCQGMAGDPKSLDPQASGLLEAQDLTDGSPLYGAFAEVKPEDDRDIDFARGYFDPIRVLASAYALRASRHYHSEAVAKAIREGLTFTRKHVYPDCEKQGNWWVWAKQMPDCLCDILAAMHGHLAPDDEAYLVSVLGYLLGTGPVEDAYYHHGKSGKDALNVLKVGVLSGDRTRIALAWEGMENAVGAYLLEDDGTPLMTVIKREFLGVSLPYIYEGYGTVVEWMGLTQGTGMALRPETSGKITDYLLGLGCWNTYGDSESAWLSFTPYRVFWRPATTRSMAGTVAGLDTPHAAELRAMSLGQDTPPEGVRFWPNAETLIFRSPGLYCSLVMASKNRHQVSHAYKNHFLHIGNKWYYGRDGHLVIARRAEEASPDLTYTLDWQRLTGVTRDDGSVLESEQFVMEDHGYWQPAHIVCENPVAGAAVVGGRDAVAGIEVHSGDTRARKSYFFLQDKDMIVTLGSHIRGRGQTDSIVHTFPVDGSLGGIIVNGETLALKDGEPREVATPAWIFAQGTGYCFPDKGAVTVLSETRAPDFSDHGDPPPDERPNVPSQRYVSILFEHGADPQDAAYACVYFLQADASSMTRLCEEFAGTAIYGREEAGHFLTLGPYTGLAFFSRGTLAGYDADRPCFGVLRRSDGAVRLGVFEPSFEDADLTLGLPFAATSDALPHGCRLDGTTLHAHVHAASPIECKLLPQ